MIIFDETTVQPAPENHPWGRWGKGDLVALAQDPETGGWDWEPYRKQSA